MAVINDSGHLPKYQSPCHSMMSFLHFESFLEFFDSRKYFDISKSLLQVRSLRSKHNPIISSNSAKIDLVGSICQKPLFSMPIFCFKRKQSRVDHHQKNQTIHTLPCMMMDNSTKVMICTYEQYEKPGKP